MSGICGAWSLRNDDPDIRPILASLERRGPDRSHVWQEGAVAFGHALLATTPEALIEVLPLTEPDGGCTITADARLDNRDELIAALRLGRETRTIGDGELILSAYLEWGEDCPTYLLGDFAFAIWDPRLQRLFCARDHMGMRQFNYCHVEGTLFAFSTEDAALLEHQAVPKILNEGRIADFIADLECFDFTSTFFEAVHRLPPAHSLTIKSNSCEIRRYWELRAGPALTLESDAEYGAALLGVFTEAVRCRLRNVDGLGAMLSGGLDSTAIVAVAAGILSAGNEGPLQTISAVGPDASKCHETQAILSALTIEGLNPIRINQVGFNGLSDVLIRELKSMGNPFEIHGTMLRSIYITARANGLKVVLDGGAGDVVLTSNNRIASLLSTGRYKLAVRELQGERLFWNPNRPVTFMVNVFLSACWVAFAPLRVRSFWRRLRLSKPLPGAESHFARRVRFAHRRRIADMHVSMKLKSDPARRAQSIRHPNLAAGRERYDQLAGLFGVESRDPFMDIRLIEFCLSLPPEQLQKGGWPKIILRRAVEALVPQDIAWRRGKEHLGSDFTHTLLAGWLDWYEGMCKPSSPLKRYLSKRALRNLRGCRTDTPNDRTLRFFALDCFLTRHCDQGHRL